MLSMRRCMDLSSMFSAEILFRILEILAECCIITIEGAFSNSLSSSAKEHLVKVS